jgi:cytoskeleton protein RodZ
MAPESNQDTFGSYLKSFRHKRELAIETVADATRIAVHCLKAMEADAHDRLPPPAYVKSFIRSYAQAVGANADVALNLYLSDLEHQATTRRQHLKRAGQTRSAAPHMDDGGIDRLHFAAGPLQRHFF